MDNKKDERKFNEEKLLLYKQTKDENLFIDIINDKDLKNYIYYVCRQKLKNYPSVLLSIEDFVNIAYLVVWQCIEKYRFICPICKINAKSLNAYKIHSLSKHGEYNEPLVSISKFIKFNLGAYLQNELRKEYSKDRKSNILTINIYSPEEKNGNEINSNKKEFELFSYLIEDEIIFQQTIKSIMNKFDDLTKEVFIYLYEKNMKQCDIAEIFYKRGRYSSEQSAKVVISRIVKNKINPVIINLYEKT